MCSAPKSYFKDGNCVPICNLFCTSGSREPVSVTFEHSPRGKHCEFNSLNVLQEFIPEIDEYGSVISEAPFVYEACPSIDKIKKRVNVRLNEYNEKYPAKHMPLVIFDDALFHLLRLTRTVNAPAGNALLVGVGGSGK